LSYLPIQYSAIYIHLFISIRGYLATNIIKINPSRTLSCLVPHSFGLDSYTTSSRSSSRAFLIPLVLNRIVEVLSPLSECLVHTSSIMMPSSWLSSVEPPYFSLLPSPCAAVCSRVRRLVGKDMPSPDYTGFQNHTLLSRPSSQNVWHTAGSWHDVLICPPSYANVHEKLWFVLVSRAYLLHLVARLHSPIRQYQCTQLGRQGGVEGPNWY